MSTITATVDDLHATIYFCNTVSLFIKTGQLLSFARNMICSMDMQNFSGLFWAAFGRGGVIKALKPVIYTGRKKNSAGKPKNKYIADSKCMRMEDQI